MDILKVDDAAHTVNYVKNGDETRLQWGNLHCDLCRAPVAKAAVLGSYYKQFVCKACLDAAAAALADA